MTLFTIFSNKAADLPTFFTTFYALDMPDQEKIDQEINSLRHIKDGFPQIIIAGGLTPSHVNADGISIINVIDFLKNSEWTML